MQYTDPFNWDVEEVVQYYDGIFLVNRDQLRCDIKVMQSTIQNVQRQAKDYVLALVIRRI